ncbi:MAG: hypothetical protein ACK5T3_09500, partial [Betaproteobacteria bacterium]
LQLHGWSSKRRVVIVRQRIRGGIARERRVDGKQLKLDLAGPSVHEGERIANIGAALRHVRAAAEQFMGLDRWGHLLRYISDRIAPVIGPPKPPPALQATG